MDATGSVWTTYLENTDDLKKKLLYTSFELEAVKNLAAESQENVKNLLNLLKLAYNERDEARDQLQTIFNKITVSNVQFNQVVLPESPALMPTKANSSITESNSHSGTYNPVDSLFDAAVSSPEFSNINMADSSSNICFAKQQPMVEGFNGSSIMPVGVKRDPADEIIDNIVKGRLLPQQGKLMQAVMDAGPLLQTVLVAGPMPRWRNPPPPLQPFKIPPVSIKGYEAAAAAVASFDDQKPVTNHTYVVHKTHNLTSYPETTRGFSQTCSAAMLNFNNVNPAGVSYQGNSRMYHSNAGFDHQIPIAKRHRLQ